MAESLRSLPPPQSSPASGEEGSLLRGSSLLVLGRGQHVADVIEQRIEVQALPKVARGGERRRGAGEIATLEAVRDLRELVQQFFRLRRLRYFRTADQRVEPRRQALALNEDVADRNRRKLRRGIARLL